MPRHIQMLPTQVSLQPSTVCWGNQTHSSTHLVKLTVQTTNKQSECGQGMWLLLKCLCSMLKVFDSILNTTCNLSTEKVQEDQKFKVTFSYIVHVQSGIQMALSQKQNWANMEKKRRRGGLRKEKRAEKSASTPELYLQDHTGLNRLCSSNFLSLP